jgi:hypothetical protein
MTENEDKPKETSVEEKEETKEETKKYKEKPVLPSVAHLLQYGAEPDPNAKPETFLQSLVMPGLLLLTFVVSLAIFHLATDGFKGGNHGKGTAGPSFQQRFARKPEF